MPSQTPHEALSKLLTRLFSAPELREFLRFGPEASGIYPYLPEHGVSQAELALAVVDLLERRGRIDEPWFQRLQEVRPGRRAEVRAVAAMFGVDVPEPQVAPPAPVPAVAAPETTATESVHAKVSSGHNATNRPVSRLWGWVLGALVGSGMIIWVVSQSQGEDPTSPGPTPEVSFKGQPGAPEPAKPEGEAPAKAVPTTPMSTTPMSATPTSTTPGTSASIDPTTAMIPESASTKPPSPKESSRRATKAMTQLVDRVAGKAIDDCAAQAGALTEETVTVDLEIAARGKVTATLAHGTTLGSRYHDCVAAAVRPVKFPAATEDQRFQYQRKIR